jgi:type II secretory pathway component PulK
MKTQMFRTRWNRGSAYLTVFVVMILFGTMLAAYLKLVGSQNQQTMRSQTWNRSVAVLEAGIEEALAHLNKKCLCGCERGV